MANQTPKQEAEHYVWSGNLRRDLSGACVSDKAIQYIIDAYEKGTRIRRRRR